MGPDVGGYNTNESEEDNGFMSGKKLTSPDILLILIIGVIWFIFRNIQPLYYMKDDAGQYVAQSIGMYDLMFGMLIICILLGNASYIWLKHRTPKLICDPIFSSTNGEGELIGIYRLFRLGAIRAWGQEYRGRDGTIIVPDAFVEHKGRNVCLHGPAIKIDMNALPNSIRGEILSRGFPAPFYRIYVSDYTSKRLPNARHLIAENIVANSDANMYEDTMKSRTKTFEDMEDWVGRVKKLAEEPGFGYSSGKKKKKEED